MSFSAKLDLKQLIRVPTNRYLRHQYAKNKSMSIVTFIINGQTYGVDALKVQEITTLGHVLKLANLPNFIKGLIKYHGSVVPVIDLRLRCHLASITPTDQTKLLILKLKSRLTGIIVDSVADIVLTRDIKFSPVPANIGDIDHAYLLGLGSAKNSQLLLCDIDELMADAALMSEYELMSLNTVIDLVKDI